MISNARVAIVDDDASVRKALTRLLGILHFSVESYETAQEFVEALQCGVPDCLVLDLQMPEMNGFDLQQYLRRMGYRIPTIVITAHDQTGLREQCEAAGAAAYLLKPLGQDELIAAIRATATKPANEPN
jgi:FixJ family two-component response regulator